MIRSHTVISTFCLRDYTKMEGISVGCPLTGGVGSIFGSSLKWGLTAFGARGGSHVITKECSL